MERPYIICHMTMSLDGKVTGDFLTTPEASAAAEVSRSAMVIRSTRSFFMWIILPSR